jgi:ribose transport system permease protein
MSDAVAARSSKKNIQIQNTLDRKARNRAFLETVLPFAGPVFIFVFFIFITEGKFLNPGNLENLINQSFVLVLVSFGAAFVYAHGGMDFSMGAVSGVAQLVMGLCLVNFNIPAWLAIVICILTSVVCSGMVGGLSIVFRVPVFVCSLCMRSICTGILATVLSSSEIIIPYGAYLSFNNAVLKGGVLVILFILCYYLFEYTALGKREKAIGGNRLSSGQAGVRVGGNIFIAYIILGICVGAASAFTLFRASVVFAQSGSGLEFDIMTAIALGGFPFTGGDKARLQAAVVGAVTVSILTNGLRFWGLDPMLVNSVKGLLFLVIVGISYDRSSGKLVQ